MHSFNYRLLALSIISIFFESSLAAQLPSSEIAPSEVPGQKPFEAQIAFSGAFAFYEEPSLMYTKGPDIGIKAHFRWFDPQRRYTGFHVDLRQYFFDYTSNGTGSVGEQRAQFFECSFSKGTETRYEKEGTTRWESALLFSNYYSDSLENAVTTTGHRGYTRSISKLFLMNRWAKENIPWSKTAPHWTYGYDVQYGVQLFGLVQCLNMDFYQFVGARVELGSRLCYQPRASSNCYFLRPFIRWEFAGDSIVNCVTIAYRDKDDEIQTGELMFKEPANYYLFVGIETGVTF